MRFYAWINSGGKIKHHGISSLSSFVDESKIVDSDVGGEVSDPAPILVSLEVHVSVLPPLFGPPVLENPGVFGVPDEEHGVVDGLRGAERVVVDAVVVELESVWAGVDGDWQRAHGGQSGLQGRLVVGREHGPTADVHFGQARHVPAQRLAGRVRVVLGQHQAVQLQVVEGVPQRPAFASQVTYRGH